MTSIKEHNTLKFQTISLKYPFLYNNRWFKSIRITQLKNLLDNYTKNTIVTQKPFFFNYTKNTIMHQKPF